MSVCLSSPLSYPCLAIHNTGTQIIFLALVTLTHEGRYGRYRSGSARERLNFPTVKKLLSKSQYDIVTIKMESRMALDLSVLRCRTCLY
jgi:hypothetical protein